MWNDFKKLVKGYCVFLIFAIICGSIMLVFNNKIGYLPVIIVSLLMTIFSISGYKKRCTHCKKWFALTKVRETHIKSEDISIVTEVKIRNKQGEVTGTQEQYIPGTRDFYEIDYECRKCGEMFYKTYSEDNKKI